MPAQAAPWLLSAFLALTAVAWIYGDPPGAAPDEAAHYVKALGAGTGELNGSATSDRGAGLASFLRLTPRQAAALAKFARARQDRRTRWLSRTSRKFSVPAGLGFDAFGCGALRTETSASCLDAGRTSTRAQKVTSYTGTYQPYPYVVPGLLMRAAGNPMEAMRLGRLGMAVIAVGLLVLAAFLLWDGGRGPIALVGLLAALTPATVYFAATLNPSGEEIAASVCFCASLLALAREPPSGPTWPALAVSGSVLVTTRSAGPAFAALIAATVALAVGTRPWAAAIRAAPRRAAVVGGAVALAAIAGLAWEIAAQPHPSGSILAELRPSFSQLSGIGRQAVGVFGPLDTPLPSWLPVAWGLGLLALLAAAGAAATGRARLRLGGMVLLVGAGTILVLAVTRRTGFSGQGRYVLPLLVILPLVAGELLDRRRPPLGPATTRRLVVGAAAFVAVAQLVGWWVSARRFAVGTDGAWFFPPDAEWSPPGGWAPWIVAAALGALCCALAGLAAARAIEGAREG